jgi:hypothetical protein
MIVFLGFDSFVIYRDKFTTVLFSNYMALAFQRSIQEIFQQLLK